MKMPPDYKKTDLFFIVPCALFLIIGISLAVINYGSVKSNGVNVPIPSIGADEDYGKDFQTYDSDPRFSFKYPAYYSAELLPKLSGETTDRILLYHTATGWKQSSIWISIAGNEENLTPEEWMLSDGGLEKGQKYFTTSIDGQDVVYTDGGMWFAFNTPDNKYRISITDLPSESGDRPFTEMGILFESLKFKK